MNANELADEIKTMLADAESYYGEVEIYLTKAETMLRQQQAEIKKWTDQYQRLNENLEMWKAGHFKQQAEIEALKSVVYWLKENRPEVWEDIQKWRKQ